MQPWRFTAEAFPYLHKEGFFAKQLNHTTDLVRNIRNVKRDQLHEEFRELIECAPRRADAGKDYFVNHSGVPSSGKRANSWSEEILAMALWNERIFLPRSDGTEIFMLDYQFPLRASSSDSGIGEVDLLGITNQGQLMVIELKVKPVGVNNRGYTPAAALLQGLRYAAIVQANFGSIARELKQRFEISIPNEPLIVQVLAPEDWWNGWIGLEASTRRAAGKWEIAFEKLAKDIEGRIGIAIECAALNVKRGGISFNEEGRPKLDCKPEILLFNPATD